jgi:predicted DCC family thiol-disulfide oxidoreductase YuxK
MPRAAATVLYDGHCRLCAGSARWLRAIDAFGRLELADARDPAVLARFPQVDPARAFARLQLVRADGGPPLEGFFAFRWIARRLPALWALWPWLWLPGAAAIGTRAYDAIARRRFGNAACGGSGQPPCGPLSP